MPVSHKPRKSDLRQGVRRGRWGAVSQEPGTNCKAVQVGTAPGEDIQRQDAEWLPTWAREGLLLQPRVLSWDFSEEGPTALHRCF
jgi:hypothetical protein